MVRDLVKEGQNIASTSNVLGWLEMGTSAIPLPGGALVRTGSNLMSLGFSAAQGNLQQKAAENGIMQNWNFDNNEADMNNALPTNSLLKRQKNDADMAVVHSLGSGVVGIGGSAIGAGIGSAVLPVGGTLIGGIAGNIVTQYLYSLATTSPEREEAMNISSDIDQKRSNGGQVTAEEVFLMMAANLPDTQRQLVLDKLQKDFHTTDLHKIAERISENDDDRAKVTLLMKSQENNILAAKGMLPDPMNPDMTTPERFAQFLNNTSADERPAMVAMLNKTDMAMLIQMQDQQAQMAMSGDTGGNTRLPYKLRNSSNDPVVG